MNLLPKETECRFGIFEDRRPLVDATPSRKRIHPRKEAGWLILEGVILILIETRGWCEFRKIFKSKA